LTPDASPAPAIYIEDLPRTALERVTPNPLGGYVEVRTHLTDAKQPPEIPTSTLELRFVDEALQPLGVWHTVVTYHQQIDWWVKVDQQGRALVLAFMFPPSFGPPAPPSEWKFSARWVGASGPLSDEFQPMTPIFKPNSSSGFPLFGGWGTILPLPEGGFAMFQYQVDPRYGGTISPTGWYAYYPSGQAGSQPAPRRLKGYDGSLRLLSGGVGYAAAVQQDPNTCARTMLLIAPSGRTCFTLAVEGTEVCKTGYPDAVWPDGTLVLQNSDGHTNCLMEWWPGLARPKQ
jgi:hypothetical protein